MANGNPVVRALYIVSRIAERRAELVIEFDVTTPFGTETQTKTLALGFDAAPEFDQFVTDALATFGQQAATAKTPVTFAAVAVAAPPAT